MPQLRNYEKPEVAFRGPFGGIMSEIPQDAIETLGFFDAVNIIFRLGLASVRPSYEVLPAFPLTPVTLQTEPIRGIFDFFDSTGARVDGIITPTRVFTWDGVTPWTQVTGAALTGLSSQIFKWSVVGQKLCFSQGTDAVQLWDGITPGFAVASGNAVPAKFLMELDFRLLVANTIEGGTVRPQRLRWTGLGDPTDWISFLAGSKDLFNDFGPITGLVKLYQAGFAFQQRGITRIDPTGIGTDPFHTSSVESHDKGCPYPYTLIGFGEDIAAYVGNDNVYTFDGSRGQEIGDFPLTNISGYRGGALSRILNDIRTVDPNAPFGYISSNCGGSAFKAYWLFIPGVAVYVFNFKEGNWTRFAFDRVPSMVDTVSLGKVVRIKDLVGPISAQSWSPATLQPSDAQDDMFIGFTDGTPSLFFYGSVSESPWSLTTGQINFADPRHTKTHRRWRLVLQDHGPASFNIDFSSEIGDIQTVAVNFDGTGSGQVRTKIVEMNINGVYIIAKFYSNAGTPLNIVEFSPIYDIGGEHKGG